MKIPYYLFCAIAGLMASSCIEESLDSCPDEGGKVEVLLSVEKFRTQPPYGPDDLEPRFADRIHSLGYLLYADGQLLERGTLADAAATEGGQYVFRHDPLPFGRYRLAFVANTAPEMMEGRPERPEAYYIVYQGEGKGDDHFLAELPFEVACPISNDFESVLRRVHGVVRFDFENIPSEITAVEVTLDNVGARVPLSGAPDQSREVTKRVPAAQIGAGAFTLGVFPTLAGTSTSLRLRLYGADAAKPFYEKLVTDTLHVVANQLLNVSIRFEPFTGEVRFTVDVDTAWDGSLEGGGGEVSVE